MSNSTPKPKMSALFESRKPSAIRVAQIRFAQRTDGIEAINLAIGNVSLPMYPAMSKRMFSLNAAESPFRSGVVKYSSTSGSTECIDAFLNVIASSGFDSTEIHGHITEGGTQAMELLIAGVCGPAGSLESPLFLIDAAYTNYKTLCERLGRSTCSITRNLGDDGQFSMPDPAEFERVIQEKKPGALLMIPFDNPTGQLYSKETLVDLARLAVKYNLWLVSDEAYRELYYVGDTCPSIWGLEESDVPGITGRRISIETSSKVWNACGLRIGALMTDNKTFHGRAIAEHTVSLCSNVIGQYIFGALAHESHETLKAWYQKQRNYYRSMLLEFTSSMNEALDGVIVSRPDAALYSVIDVRRCVDKSFEAMDFVVWCAEKGFAEIEGRPWTLLAAPMSGFYSIAEGLENPGRTQMRIAFVESPEKMAVVPKLFAALLEKYLQETA